MKKIIILLLSIIAIFSLVSCSGKDESSSNISEDESKGKILVYLSGPEEMLNKLETLYEKDNGDVLDFNILSCGQLRSKTWAESEAGKINADVIWGSDPLLYNKLDEENLLMPLTLKEEDNLQDRFLLSDKNYTYVNERYIIIMYNNTLLSENIPTSYSDLTNDCYKNKITMADSNLSSTAFAIAASLYQMTGNNDSYFKELANNNLSLAKSNGLVPSKIMEGEFSVGIAPHDAVVRLQNKAKKEGYSIPLDMVWPSEGAIAIQRPVAITKNTDRTEQQQKTATSFIDFLQSKEAQSITNQFGFVSVRKDIENNYLVNNATSYDINWEECTCKETEIKDAFTNIFH